MLLVRTNDEKLKRALERWFEEEGRFFPPAEYVITDIDSFDALGVPGEITCSYDGNALLRRPFSFEELKERLTRVPDAPRRLLFADGAILLDGEKLYLTASEEKILRALYEAKVPVSAAALAELLGEESPRSNKIAVHIASLRRKTEKSGRPRLIRTERLKGYFVDHD